MKAIVKRRTLRKNLFWSFALIVILIAGLYLLLFFGRDYKSSKTRYLKDWERLVSQIASQTDDYFTSMNNITVQLVYSNIIYESLAAANADTNSSNFFDDNSQIKKNCSLIMSAYSSITNQASRVSIFGMRGDYCSVGSSRRNLRTSDILQLDILKASDEKGGALCIRGPFPDPLSENRNDGRYIYSASRIMKYGYASYGYVEVQQPYEALHRICSVSPDMQVFVYDDSGNMLYPLRNPAQNSSEQDLLRLQNVKQHLTHADSCLIKADDEILGGAKLKNNLILVAAEKQSVLYSNLYQVRNTTVFFTLIVCFLCILIVYSVSGYTAQSVEKLTSAVKKINFQDYTLPISPEECTTDETRQLAEATGHMLQKLKQFATLTSEAQARELQATIAALQSQINPHFMNNTLAAISSSAMESGNMNVVYMCSHLSRMLLYTLDGEQEATLDSEVEYTRHYLELMRYRYGGGLKYDIEIPPAILSVRIPRLILQPLVENCIYHGFDCDRELRVIQIKGEQKDRTWTVRVIDNGCGFSREALQKITADQEKIRGLLDSGRSSFMRSEELGVLNTFSRLYIRQKEHTVFEIHSSTAGATVIIGGQIHD